MLCVEAFAESWSHFWECGTVIATFCFDFCSYSISQRSWLKSLCVWVVLVIVLLRQTESKFVVFLPDSSLICLIQMEVSNAERRILITSGGIPPFRPIFSPITYHKIVQALKLSFYFLLTSSTIDLASLLFSPPIFFFLSVSNNKFDSFIAFCHPSFSHCWVSLFALIFMKSKFYQFITIQITFFMNYSSFIMYCTLVHMWKLMWNLLWRLKVKELGVNEFHIIPMFLSFLHKIILFLQYYILSTYYYNIL